MEMTNYPLYNPDLDKHYTHDMSDTMSCDLSSEGAFSEDMIYNEMNPVGNGWQPERHYESKFMLGKLFRGSNNGDQYCSTADLLSIGPSDIEYSIAGIPDMEIPTDLRSLMGTPSLHYGVVHPGYEDPHEPAYDTLSTKFGDTLNASQEYLAAVGSDKDDYVQPVDQLARLRSDINMNGLNLKENVSYTSLSDFRSGKKLSDSVQKSSSCFFLPSSSHGEEGNFLSEDGDLLDCDGVYQSMIDLSQRDIEDEPSKKSILENEYTLFQECVPMMKDKSNGIGQADTARNVEEEDDEAIYELFSPLQSSQGLSTKFAERRQSMTSIERAEFGLLGNNVDDLAFAHARSDSVASSAALIRRQESLRSCSVLSGDRGSIVEDWVGNNTSYHELYNDGCDEYVMKADWGNTENQPSFANDGLGPGGFDGLGVGSGNSRDEKVERGRSFTNLSIGSLRFRSSKRTKASPKSSKSDQIDQEWIDDTPDESLPTGNDKTVPNLFMQRQGVESVFGGPTDSSLGLEEDMEDVDNMTTLDVISSELNIHERKGARGVSMKRRKSKKATKSKGKDRQNQEDEWVTDHGASHEPRSGEKTGGFAELQNDGNVQNVGLQLVSAPPQLFLTEANSVSVSPENRSILNDVNDINNMLETEGAASQPGAVAQGPHSGWK